jgi:hypothetical protein
MRLDPWKIGLIFFVCLVSRLSALKSFSDDELTRPPSPARLAEIEHVAATNGWGCLVPGLRTLAFHAYENNSPSAEAWFLLSRWTILFATRDDQFMPRWNAAINAAQVGHANMPTTYAVRHRPLADYLSPALQTWLLSHTDFSAEFFSLLSPCDLLPKSFEILSELQKRYPEKFPVYASLALAIAVVYDVPPPPHWPHAQVSAAALPRTLPDPAAAFAFWVHADETGQTLQPLSRLPASELKFVVDAVAPAAELEWAQQNIATPLASFANVYGMVRYRVDRVQQSTFLWPQSDYGLKTLLDQGGLCVDQAYFACEVGKAKGVPTLFFEGAGRDAWHAWFGYLDQNGQWQLDAGRYANQQLVTGLAIDPQTWGPISDHDLKFLSEGFRLLPSWRQACLNADFAAAYLADGKYAAAAAAARTAVNFEPRDLAAWNTLAGAQKRLGASPTDMEALMREAALAFQNYPDIEAAFVGRIAESVRARGQSSEADYEQSQFADKVGTERADLNVDHAVDLLSHSMATDDMATQLRTYYSILNTYGRGGGADFFGRIVLPFANHLQDAGRPRDALAAAASAKNVLQIEPNSQLDRDLQALVDKFTAASQN